MPEAVNRYRFCGLLTGVNMLPRFAAMVMSVATRHMRPSIPARRKATKASGERDERDVVGHRHAGEERKPDQHAGNRAASGRA